jgi:transcriptional regulator with XRE-family HTH domain
MADKTFGELFRSVVTLRDGSLRRFSERTGLDYSKVNRWANDKHQPKLETVEKLAAMLDVEPSELLPTAFARADSADARVEYDSDAIPAVLQEWLDGGGLARFGLNISQIGALREVAAFDGVDSITLDQQAFLVRSIVRGWEPREVTDPRRTAPLDKLAKGELKRVALPKKRR